MFVTKDELETVQLFLCDRFYEVVTYEAHLAGLYKDKPSGSIRMEQRQYKDIGDYLERLLSRLKKEIEKN